MNSAIRSGIAAMLGLIILWQIIVSLTGVPRFILPSPYLVGVSFIENRGLIFEHMLVTLTEVIFGLIIGIALGLSLIHI